MQEEKKTEEEKLIEKKAIFNKNCKVHIIFKNSKWENGEIIQVGADFLILRFINADAIRFHQCIQKPFFFMEIADIEELRVRK